MNVLIFLIILLVLVVAHEFGHFFAAKKFGMKVEEFSFGFPPKLFGKKIGETEYNFNILPVGGYVKIFGEDPNQDSLNGPDSGRSFVNKPYYAQAVVILGGIIMNFLVAWFLFSAGFVYGLPTSEGANPKGTVLENSSLTVTGVMQNSPAESSGLKVGDRISLMSTDTDQTETPSTESLQYFVRRHGGENITVSYTRGSEELQTVVVPVTSASDMPMIGISMDIIGTLKLPVHKALWEGLKLTWHTMVVTAVGFYNLISGALTGHGSFSAVTGPVGIVGIVGDAAKFGFVYLLSFTALISVNLAVLNLIPFPALDGGRLLFVLIEKIKGSRIDPVIANTVNLIGFSVIMLLMVVVTYHDIVKLF